MLKMKRAQTKTTALAILLLLLTAPLQAQRVKDMWINMPDSLIPYLNKNMRTELVDFVNMKVKAEVKNLLGEESVMDTLTSNYLCVTLNEAATVQMRMLPQLNGDSIMCMVRSTHGPATDSELSFWSKNWQRLEQKDCTGGAEAQQLLRERLIVKPDTMAEARFKELSEMIEPFLVRASLSPTADILTLEVSLPMLSAEDKKAVKAILMQRKLNWNGETFN